MVISAGSRGANLNLPVCPLVKVPHVIQLPCAERNKWEVRLHSAVEAALGHAQVVGGFPAFEESSVHRCFIGLLVSPKPDCRRAPRSRFRRPVPGGCAVFLCCERSRYRGVRAGGPWRGAGVARSGSLRIGLCGDWSAWGVAGLRIFVPGSAVKDTSSRSLVCSAPLLEEERYPGDLALIAE